MTKSSFVPWRWISVLASALGLAIGWLDVHTTEVIVTIVPLLAAGMVLGLLRPGGAWRSAAVMVIGLSVMVLVAWLTGMQTAEPVQLDPRVTLVELAFALVGTYAGVLVRRAIHGLTRRAPTRRA